MPCKLGITSMSLGRATAGHSLTHKLDMAHKYGYQGIELFYEDLLGEAATRFPDPPSPSAPGESSPSSQGAAAGPSRESQLAAARHIREMCAERGLTIICLQPLAHYEGLVDRAAHAAQLAKLRFWVELAHAVGTDMIQVPSSFLPADQVSADADLIVSDLQELADVGAAADPPLRFVYEALCWGTRADTWEASWEVVRRVGRPNFGLCLDSFNIAGRVYADPTARDGRNGGAAEAVRRSMERLVRELRPHADRVFYVQIVDAERLAAPLVEGHPFHHPDQPPRMSWSRNCRLFYGEAEYGAYLPVREIAETFFHKLGFEGWVSLELFNRRMGDEDKGVPEELAMRGALSWRRLVDDMKLDVDVPPAVQAVPEPLNVSASLSPATSQKTMADWTQAFSNRLVDVGE